MNKKHTDTADGIEAASCVQLWLDSREITDGTRVNYENILNQYWMPLCRTVALGVIEERTKNRGDRFVLLNERAMHALEFARAYAERRKMGVGKVTETPYVFTPSKNNEYIKQTSDLHHQWCPVLKALGVSYRLPYNCRHTYATICAMSGINPAFISQQLGHRARLLLSTYTRWINSSSDWSALEPLNIASKSISATSSQP